MQNGGPGVLNGDVKALNGGTGLYERCVLRYVMQGVHRKWLVVSVIGVS